MLSIKDVLLNYESHQGTHQEQRKKITPCESFYIHWPFCPYRCHFCPFVALAGQDEHMEDYHSALFFEINSFLENTEAVPLKTVFFGGGTPSTYPVSLLAQTIELLRSKRGFVPSYEMTIEVNPGTVTIDKLHAWKEAGINRLSIGVQSLNDSVLKGLNRHQKAQDVLDLLDAAAPLFDNLSVDLIVGLPGISSDEWRSMIQKIVLWPISHVSMYFLTVHEDTQLYFGIKSNRIQLPTDDDVVDLYYWTIKEFERAGLIQYEISNFSRAGRRSEHNSVYWHRAPYKGFGLGACSFDGAVRSQNEKNLMKYLSSVKNGIDITFFSEELSDKQVWLEQLMLGLRQRSGVGIQGILQPLTDKEKEAFYTITNELSEAGLVKLQEDTIALTPGGLSVANEIIVKLSCI
jgi:oxygen-independent coproporphyrinogen III oxidase